MSTRIRHCIEISCSTNTKEEPHEFRRFSEAGAPGNELGVKMLAFEMLWEGAPSSRDTTQNRSSDGDFPFEIDGDLAD